MTARAAPNQLSNASSVSIVLPVAGEEDALVDALEGYVGKLQELGPSWEILLIADARQAPGGYQRARSVHSAIRTCPGAAGWGGAVRAGLGAAGGDVLCFSNWRRTSAAALGEMVDLALRDTAVVLRASRRTRDTRLQRIGSLLFNLECRFVLQVPAWDINGTPKIFPRAFGRLLELTRDDDLLDAEFALVCERAGYPVVEIPVNAELVAGAARAPTPTLRAALRMYASVRKLRRAGSEPDE